MSGHPAARDRRAAYAGLIVGVLVLAAVLYSIVRLTNARYEKTEGAKPTASAVGAGGLTAK